MDMNYLIVLVLSALPISEIRGAIMYSVGQNLNIYLAFFLALLGNILIIPVIFFVLEKLKLLKLAKILFGRSIYKKIEKNQTALDKWGEVALLLFVAIPAPITGGWTATLIATLLEMDKKKSWLVISIGIMIAGVITLGISKGVVSIFSL